MLELVALHPEGLTMSEIASAVAAPISSIKDLLNGLVRTGFLDRNQNHYILGPAPYMLTLRARQTPARSITHHDLELLAREGGFTVILGVRVGDDVVYIDEAGDHPVLQHRARTRARTPLLDSVAGKVLIASLPDAEMHEYLRRNQHKDLVAEFLAGVTAIRSSGVAVELHRGISPRPGYPGIETGTVAAAVHDHQGRVVGAVVIGHDPEYFNAHLDNMIEQLLRHTRHWATRRGTTELADQDRAPVTPHGSDNELAGGPRP